MSGAGNCSCFNVCLLFIVEDGNSWFAFAPGFGSFQPLEFLAADSAGDVRGDFCVPGCCCASEPWSCPALSSVTCRGSPVPPSAVLCCAGSFVPSAGAQAVSTACCECRVRILLPGMVFMATLCSHPPQLQHSLHPLCSHLAKFHSPDMAQPWACGGHI